MHRRENRASGRARPYRGWAIRSRRRGGSSAPSLIGAAPTMQAENCQGQRARPWMLIVNQGSGGADVFRSDDALMQGHLQDFGNMQGVAAGGLLDLLAATEAIGDDERAGRGLARRGQNH